MFRRLLVAAAWLAVSAVAAPPLTTIQDVLYKADGTRFSGTLTISWQSFQPGVGSGAVPKGATVVKVVDGYLRVQLVPTTTASPAVNYTVLYNSDGRNQFRELWAVPSSVQPLRVQDVRVSAAAAGGAASDTSGSGSPSVESDIVGLLADLGARPVKGPNFAAGRVAVVDASGLLASVSGDPSDCVRVDGSTGACGSQGPAFMDGDTLAGLVDGANTSFGLSTAPNPPASLAVYRNGVLQKAGQDYTLGASVVQFVAASTPQPGDTLLASYRIADSGASGTAPSGTSPQVLCGGSGTTTQSTTPAAIGTCTIPAGVVAAGDRVEIRFDVSHQNSAGGFSVELDWGGTAMVHRDAAASETLVSGRADAALAAGGAQTSSQTWGTALAFGATAGNAADVYASGLTVTLMGSVVQASDSLTANNFTVVRMP